MNGFGFGFSAALGTLLNQTPDAPTSLTASVVSDVRIDLAWTINATNHDGHRIYISTDNVNFTEKGTVSGETATYSATSLTDGTIYYFKVVAYKGSNESTPTSTVDACTIPSKFLAATVKYWHDYTDTTLKTLVSGRVSQVNDKSANAYHQTQSTAGVRPYDLGADGIQGQGAQRIGNATNLGVDGNCTVMAVIRIDTFENSRHLISGAITTNSSTPRLNQDGWNPLYVNAPSNGTWFLISSVVNNSSTDIFQINNDTPVTGTTNQHQTPVSNILGGTNDTAFAKASFKFAICINEVLSDADLTKAKTYVNWKYQVFF